MERYRVRGVMRTENWGGRIMTSDAMEFLDGEIVFRNGQTFMDSVEIYNCSQQDTYDAALAWNSATLESSVSNSAIHSGMGWGVYIESSMNINFDNNVIYDFRPVGVAVDAVKNVAITNNILMKVVERDTIEANWNYIDRKGGFAICSVMNSISSCSNITVNYNTAVGITMAGFWAIT